MIIDRKKNTVRNFKWGIVNKAVMMFSPFICRTIIIFYFGSEFLGLESLFTSILQMLNITELGFSSAVVFSMYKPIAQNDERKICALLNLYRKVYRIIGCVILIVGLVLIPFLPYLIKGDVPNDVNICVLYLVYLINTVLGYWLFAYKNALLVAHQRMDIQSNINSIVVLLRIVVQLVVVCFFRNYYLYILVLPINTVLNNIYIARVTKKIFPQYVCCGSLDEQSKKDISQRIKGLMIQKVCATSRNSMDNIIISAYVGLSSVAIYGNYYAIMSAVHGFLSIITNAMSAGVGNGIAVDSVEENHEKMMTFNFMYMWIASNATICLLCLYQPFMMLWLGKDYMFPMYIVVLLCIYCYSLCMGDIRSLYTTGAGLWWEGRYRSMLEALTNIVLNILLGYFWGITGVVLATIISILVVNFGYGATIVYKHYFKNGKVLNYYLQHFKYALVTIVVGFIAYTLCGLVEIKGICGLILKLFLCVFVTNFLFVVVYMKNPECKKAFSFLKRLCKKV